MEQQAIPPLPGWAVKKEKLKIAFWKRFSKDVSQIHPLLSFHGQCVRDVSRNYSIPVSEQLCDWSQVTPRSVLAVMVHCSMLHIKGQVTSTASNSSPFSVLLLHYKQAHLSGIASQGSSFGTVLHDFFYPDSRGRRQTAEVGVELPPKAESLHSWRWLCRGSWLICPHHSLQESPDNVRQHW